LDTGVPSYIENAAIDGGGEIYDGMRIAIDKEESKPGLFSFMPRVYK
jgi:hypothetical protein